MEERTGTAILLSNKIHFKPKAVKKGQGKALYNDKKLIQKEEITIKIYMHQILECPNIKSKQS